LSPEDDSSLPSCVSRRPATISPEITSQKSKKQRRRLGCTALLRPSWELSDWAAVHIGPVPCAR
jgi:hypothetical protein